MALLCIPRARNKCHTHRKNLALPNHRGLVGLMQPPPTPVRWEPTTTACRFRAPTSQSQETWQVTPQPLPRAALLSSLRRRSSSMRSPTQEPSPTSAKRTTPTCFPKRSCSCLMPRKVHPFGNLAPLVQPFWPMAKQLLAANLPTTLSCERTRDTLLRQIKICIL